MLAASAIAAALLTTGAAQAQSPGFVVLGVLNIESSTTRIGYDNVLGFTLPGDGLFVSSKKDTSGRAISAYSYNGNAIEGASQTKAGVFGWGYGESAYAGIHGFMGHANPPTRPPDDTGVFGENTTGTGSGVYGRTSGVGPTGVLGGVGVFGVGLTGVRGQGTLDGVAGFTSTAEFSGVYGQNDGGGTGVRGVSNGHGGVGVLGFTERRFNGIGVFGNGATGVLARGTTTAIQATGPTGLDVTGKLKFSRSGRLTIPAGASSAVTTGVSLTSSSMVLVTLQENLPGVWVRAAVPNPAANSFTVYLNANASQMTTVAYLILD